MTTSTQNMLSKLKSQPHPDNTKEFASAQPKKTIPQPKPTSEIR